MEQMSERCNGSRIIFDPESSMKVAQHSRQISSHFVVVQNLFASMFAIKEQAHPYCSNFKCTTSHRKVELK